MRVSVLKIGGSRAVILPPAWFKQHENEQGTMQEVEMEIGEIIISISPIKKEGGTNARTDQSTAGDEAADPATHAA